MHPALSKYELKRQIFSFLKDENRGISMNLFAELAGISLTHLKDVFLYQVEPLSEVVQRRVSKAYKSWQNGEVVVMQNKDGSRYIEYRKIPKPLARKSLGLIVTSDGIKIDLGMKPKYDYSGYTLDEQLKGG
jgi:AraC-like DNA-binding protein